MITRFLLNLPYYLKIHYMQSTIKKVKYSVIIMLLVCAFIPNAKATTSEYFQDDTLQTKDVVFTYPTPDELLEVIEKENISFYNKYLNPPENQLNYIDVKSKNLNLGVYLADLAYAAFFEKRSKSTAFQ